MFVSNQCKKCKSALLRKRRNLHTYTSANVLWKIKVFSKNLPCLKVGPLLSPFVSFFAKLATQQKLHNIWSRASTQLGGSRYFNAKYMLISGRNTYFFRNWNYSVWEREKKSLALFFMAYKAYLPPHLF